MARWAGPAVLTATDDARSLDEADAALDRLATSPAAL